MKNEKKALYIIDIIELIISIIGIFTFSAMFIVVNTTQRILFFFAAIYFAFNSYTNFKELVEISKERKRKVIKYAMKELNAKEKRKLSF